MSNFSGWCCVWCGFDKMRLDTNKFADSSGNNEFLFDSFQHIFRRMLWSRENFNRSRNAALKSSQEFDCWYIFFRKRGLMGWEGEGIWEIYNFCLLKMRTKNMRQNRRESLKVKAPLFLSPKHTKQRNVIRNNRTIPIQHPNYLFLFPIISCTFWPLCKKKSQKRLQVNCFLPFFP